MKETLYRPYAADGTHFCENKDREGWLKGCTLSDDSNKPNGLLDLEPYVVDTESGSPDYQGYMVALGVGFAIATVISNHKQIIRWAKETVIPSIKRKWYKLTKKNYETDEQCLGKPGKIIVFDDYLDTQSVDKNADEDCVSNE